MLSWKEKKITGARIGTKASKKLVGGVGLEVVARSGTGDYKTLMTVDDMLFVSVSKKNVLF